MNGNVIDDRNKRKENKKGKITKIKSNNNNICNNKKNLWGFTHFFPSQMDHKINYHPLMNQERDE